MGDEKTTQDIEDIMPAPVRRELHFFLEMDTIPTITAQQKGERAIGGKIIHYDKKPVKEAKALFCSLLTPHKPGWKYEAGTALRLFLIFRYPRRDLVREPAIRPKITKPDADNVAKIFIDCMTKLGFWDADCQIAHYHVVKIEVNVKSLEYDGEQTGIEVFVGEI